LCGVVPRNGFLNGILFGKKVKFLATNLRKNLIYFFGKKVIFLVEMGKIFYIFSGQFS